MLSILPYINNKQTITGSKTNKNVSFASTEKACTCPVNSKLSGLDKDTVELSSKTASKAALDMEKIKNLKISNLRRINSNSLSGGTFEIKEDSEIKKLKEAGIEKIIDFRADAKESFNNRCTEAGVEYHNIPFDDVYNLTNPLYFKRGKGEKTQIKEEFVKMLKEYFELMNSGNAYVGCHYGIDRTNMALITNYLLNKDAGQLPPQIITWPGDKKKTVLNKNIKAVKQIYKKLDAAQKQELQLPEKYQDYLKDRIATLLSTNNIIAE